jgi:hypothetical protein
VKSKKVPTHVVFIVIYVLGAIVTLLPTGTASKDCLLGYNALCSFTPISTAVFVALAGLHIFLHLRKPAPKGRSDLDN